MTDIGRALSAAAADDRRRRVAVIERELTAILDAAGFRCEKVCGEPVAVMHCSLRQAGTCFSDVSEIDIEHAAERIVDALASG